MAINFSTLGGAAAVEPTQLTSTNGVFNVDLSENTAFTLTFNESYLDTLGEQIGPAPIFVGSNLGGAANGGSHNNANIFGLSGGIDTAPTAGDFILLLSVTANNNPSYPPVSPSIEDAAGFTWTEFGYNTVTGTNTAHLSCRMWYAFYDGTQTVAPTISHGGVGTSSGITGAVVLRNVSPTNPIGTLGTPTQAGNGSFADFNALDITRDNSSVISFVFGSGTMGNADPINRNIALWDYYNSKAINDTYDAALAFGYYEGGFNNEDTAPELTDAVSISNVYWTAYQLQINAADVLSGFGPDATINAINIPEKRTEYDIVIRNQNSTGQSYNINYGSEFGALSPSTPILNGSENSIILSAVALGGSLVPLSQATKIQKIDYITETSSWTAPNDVSSIELILCGGGGGGANYNNTSGYSGGGGGGSAYYTVLSVNPGSSYTITIGAGGAGVASGTVGDGSQGSESIFSDSSLNAMFSAPGGLGSQSRKGGSGKGLGGAGGFIAMNSTYGGGGAIGQSGYHGYGSGGNVDVNGNWGVLGKSGEANTGQGGSGTGDSGASGSGGSGVAIIKYWTAT